MSWQHGYHADGTYTCGFYRELAPAWLDFATLLKGQPSPRRHPGEPFSYLELGSGMGLGLCLLAATHPEGRFTGIDFQPDHILHSRRLAASLGLTNIHFLEADFLSLASDPAGLRGCHHYVVAHGIATWILPPIRQALLQLASLSLLPGGLFYCSYNTLPGWLSTFPLQQLAWLEAQRRASHPAGAAAAVQAAAATLQALLGSEDQPSALARSLPGLRERLAGLKQHDGSYLVQEYINEGWQPMPVHAFHSATAACKLRYVASASLPENFPSLLPAAIREVVTAETDPSLRETVQDLAINQSFRRDVFCHGRDGLTSAELSDAFAGVQLRLQEAPEQDSYTFVSSLGQISGNHALYKAVEASLAEGPLSFASLQERHELSLGGLAQLISLLLHSGRLGFDRGEAGAAASDSCRRISATLMALQRGGRPYTFLPAPAIGSALAVSLPETLLEQARREAPDADPLPSLQAGLQRLGKVLTADSAATVAAFERRRPWLQALGVF